MYLETHILISMWQEVSSSVATKVIHHRSQQTSCRLTLHSQIPDDTLRGNGWTATC